MNDTVTPKIFVAGHRGMVGSAVCRRLADSEATLVTTSGDELDLRDRGQCDRFFAAHRPDVVILAAARVGGILANSTYPVEFLSDNLTMAINTINAAFDSGVQRFLFLGSTCIYPRDCEQPIREEALLTGPLEITNEAYALAKIAGLKLCQYYRQQHGVLYHSAMPTNLYGPGDNYHLQNSHVLPALIRRFHEAKIANAPSVVLWGSGTPRREFLYVDDLADAIVHLIGLDDPPDWVNVGTGIDQTITELADLIADIVEYRGEIKTDPTKPDGTPVKCADVTRLHQLGWKHKIDLAEGIERTYQAFLAESGAGQMRSV